MSGTSKFLFRLNDLQDLAEGLSKQDMSKLATHRDLILDIVQTTEDVTPEQFDDLSLVKAMELMTSGITKIMDEMGELSKKAAGAGKKSSTTKK